MSAQDLPMLIADAERRLANAHALVEEKRIEMMRAENAHADACDSGDGVADAKEALECKRAKFELAASERRRFAAELECLRTGEQRVFVDEIDVEHVARIVRDTMAEGELSLADLTDEAKVCGDCLRDAHAKRRCEEASAVDSIARKLLAWLVAEPAALALVVARFGAHKDVAEAELRAALARAAAEPAPGTTCRHCLGPTSPKHLAYAACTVRHVARAVLRLGCGDVAPLATKADTAHRKRRFAARLVEARAVYECAPAAPAAPPKTSRKRKCANPGGKAPRFHVVTGGKRLDEFTIAYVDAKHRLAAALEAAVVDSKPLPTIRVGQLEACVRENGLVVAFDGDLELDAFLRRYAPKDDEARLVAMARELEVVEAPDAIEIGGRDMAALSGAEPSRTLADLLERLVDASERNADVLERGVDELRLLREALTSKPSAARPIFGAPVESESPSRAFY